MSTATASLPTDAATVVPVRLRHWASADADGLAALLQNPTLQQRLPGAPMGCTDAQAAGLIAQAAAQWSAGKGLSLAVCRASDERLLGEVTLNLWSREIGIWLGAGHWRQGHGQSALQALLQFAQAGLRLNSAHALIWRDNLPSRGLFEKCGFLFAGLQRGDTAQGSMPRLKYVWRAAAEVHQVQASAARGRVEHHAHQD